jgi:cardiolipin hydrolase
MKSNLQEIEQALRQSLDDHLLSRAEKRSLKELLNVNHLSKQDKDWLWSRARDFTLELEEEVAGEWLLRWLYDCGKLLRNNLETKVNPARAFFSPGEACRDAICHQIRSARQHIDICVFTISDNIIRDEIADAHRIGKQIRIISDNDKSEDRGSDIDFLKERGVPLILDNTEVHMHHKFALFDQKVLLSGSYNWTRSAANYNFENILITEDHKLVTPFKKEFDRLWDKLQA